MRLLHLTDRLSSRGGADWHLLGVLDALRASHDLHLVVGRDDGTAVAPCALSVIPALAAREAAPAELDRLLDLHKPDVIHLHNIVNPTVLEWGAAHGAVMTVQDHRAFCPARGKWKTEGTICNEAMNAELCSACFTDNDYRTSMFALTETRLEAIRKMRVAVLSHYMKTELVAVGLSPDQVTVIPPFVHRLDTDAKPDGPPCALFVGRLVEAKGVREAVTAWKQSGTGLPLIIAGTGSLRAELESSGASILGWLSHERLAQLYRRATVLILPSRWQEPFGIVGLESLACGTPVAAWRSGGVSDWHSGNGLVRWGDVDALGNAIAELSGQKASTPPGFTRAEAISRLEDLYRSVG